MERETGAVEERGVEEEFVPPVAPAGKRFVGYCRGCHGFVELTPEFTCEKAGHSRDEIAVALLLDADEPKPKFPRINLGALFMPALWGPVHGHLFMILFYPVWLFMDNIIYAAVRGTGQVWLAVVASIMLAAFTVFYALKANEVGYLQVAAEKSPEEFLKGERRWSVVFVLMGVAFVAFASWYNIAVRPFA